MKLVRFIVLIFLPLITIGQLNSKLDSSYLLKRTSDFKLTFTAFNHAELIMNGVTTYTLTDKQIKVSNKSFGSKIEKVIFSKTIMSKNYIDTILNLRLDTLQEYYTNTCVMITSGDEYFLNFSCYGQKKKISLHHYYLKELDQIIKILNSLVPKEFHFTYLSKNEILVCDS